MGKTPAISIVSVTLNAASTIRDCVESVKYQTQPAQHIIIDGHSRDGTPDLARKYALPSATIVSEPDKGLYDAMNKGLSLATGDVVGTLNSDDFYPHSRVLSLVAKAFEDPELEACYGDLIYVDRKNVERIVRYWKARPFEKRLFYQGWMPPHSTFFVRRSVYEKHGGFNLDLGSAADYELMLRFLVRHEVRVGYIPEVLVIMRMGGVSNVSIRNRIQAHRLCREAWKINGLKPKPWTVSARPLSKLGQYLSRGPRSRPWLDDDWLGRNRDCQPAPASGHPDGTSHVPEKN